MGVSVLCVCAGRHLRKEGCTERKRVESQTLLAQGEQKNLWSWVGFSVRIWVGGRAPSGFICATLLEFN